MAKLTIIETIDGEIFYLNHSCLNTCSFGAVEMAWTTEDKDKAHIMLENVIRKHGRDDFQIMELF